jgi:hypothetical protein
MEMKNCSICNKKKELKFFSLVRNRRKANCRQCATAKIIEAKKLRPTHHVTLLSKLQKSAATHPYNKKHGIKIRTKEFNEWLSRQKLVCYYCSLNLNQINKIKNQLSGHAKKAYTFSFDRKNSQKGYSYDNIVLCCVHCNFRKGYIFTEQEFKEICLEFIKPKLNFLLKNAR